jgi:hypothetical protein
MAALSMEAELAQHRLHDEADELAFAWDELANAIGCALEGLDRRDRIATALERIAAAESRAQAEVAAALELIGAR